MFAPFFKDGRKGGTLDLPVLTLLSVLLLLPSLFPEKIGWVTSFVPLAVFYFLSVKGTRDGSILLRNAVILAAVGALLAGSLPVLVFSLAMIPPGVAFAYGVSRNRSPVGAGLNGALFLMLAWLLFWGILGIIHQANPYTALLKELDNGLADGLALYEKSADLAPATLENVRVAVKLMRTYIPKVMPGILVSAVLTITWLNLVLGNWLLKRKAVELTPWPDYIRWKLPEMLVWLVIVSGVVITFLPPPVRTVGLNVLLVCITLYSFQGLAIVASLLNRWSAPLLIRILIYALIFIQTYGIIILSFLGLADVWADFRKLNTTEAPRNSV